MRMFRTASVALGCLPTALSLMQFLRPPAFSVLVDPSKYPVHVTGSTIDLRWTPAEKGKKLSVVLYQLSASDAAKFQGEFRGGGDFQFITQDQVDATSFSWIVGTTFNLTISPMFALALWQQGAQTTDSTTNIFNITRDKTETSTVSTASTSISSTSTSTSIPSTSLSTASSITSTSSSTTTMPDSTATPLAGTGQSATVGLPTGGAIGLGIGIAFAVMLLAGVGWYFMRRHRGRRQHNINPGPAEGMLIEKYPYTQRPPAGEFSGEPPVFEAAAGDRRHELL